MTTTQTSRGQGSSDAQSTDAPAQTPRPAQGEQATIAVSPGEGKTSAAAIAVSTPRADSSLRSTSSGAAIGSTSAHLSAAASEQTTREGQAGNEAQASTALAGSDLPADRIAHEAQWTHVGGDQTEDGSAANVPSTPSRPPLADPFLALAADIVDDLERTRIANENRLRMLTRTEADEDGEMRGLGMDERDPNVARTAALVDMLAKAEHQAILNLNKLLREHPLGPWIRQQKGVGEKTAARLLAVVGDPYVNVATGEVRTVSQLWAYCGHGDPTRRKRKGMTQEDLFRLGNPTAKKRVWLIATAILKAGGGEEKVTEAAADAHTTTASLAAVYYARKRATEGREHATECVRCGPSGEPALPGSPWSDAHRHADALRIVGKEFLRDLWVEAKHLHEQA